MAYATEELTEAGRQIDSMLRKLRATVATLEGKDDPGRLKPQITLARRRVRALEIAEALIARARAEGTEE